MKGFSRRWRGEEAFAVLGIFITVTVLVIVGVAVYLVYHHHSSAIHADQVSKISFDTRTTGTIGPACGFPTNLGCFEPTDSQYETLGNIREQGYLTAHIVGEGYVNRETLHGSAVGGPGQKYKVIHITRIDSAKGVGRKSK
jgi:hypothetical protein